MWRISEPSSGAPLHAEKHIGLVALPAHCASRQTSRPTCRVILNHLNASATTATSDVPCPCCNSHTTRLDDNWQPRFASPYARSLSLDRKVRIKVGGSQRPTERLFRGMLKPPPTPQRVGGRGSCGASRKASDHDVDAAHGRRGTAAGKEPTHPVRPMSMQHGMLVLPGVQVFCSVVRCVMPTAHSAHMFLLQLFLDLLISFLCFLFQVFLVLLMISLASFPVILSLLFQSFGAQGAEPIFPQAHLGDAACPGTILLVS